MFLVIGLGNPGARYAETRHNVGFLVADTLARRAQARLDREQSGALAVRVLVAGQQAVIGKPQRFMNLSGGPVQALRDFYKVEVERVVVIHDDMDLPSGDVRVKVGGGHGGHNGLRDLVAQVGPGFVRVRVGVGRPPPGWDPADHVLGRWSPDEAAGLPVVVDRAADAVEAVVRDGASSAMQAFNSKPATRSSSVPPAPAGGGSPRAASGSTDPALPRNSLNSQKP